MENLEKGSDQELSTSVKYMFHETNRIERKNKYFSPALGVSLLPLVVYSLAAPWAQVVLPLLFLFCPWHYHLQCFGIPGGRV